MKTIMMLFLLLTAAGWSIASDDSTAIRVKSHIAYLASDALEGRRAGT